MTVDTSREAVEALIAEHKQLWAKGAFINASLARQIEQTLADLLDERDVAVRLRLTINGRLEQRISDLIDALADARSIRDRERSRVERAEAERDKLAARLEAVADDVMVERTAKSLMSYVTHRPVEALTPGPNADYYRAEARVALRAAILADTDDVAEAHRVAEYHDLIDGGLSDAEARGTIWPDTDEGKGEE
jgi:hypothetical protein